MGDRTTFRGRTVGWGPWRKDWASICSAHRDGMPGCRLCFTGYYSNRWAHKVGHYFYRHHYRLWHRWVNRPNSRARRDLERIFPNLRAGVVPGEQTDRRHARPLPALWLPLGP